MRGSAAGRDAGETIDDLSGSFHPLTAVTGNGAYDLEDLLHPGPAVSQVAIEFVTGAQRAGLDAAMAYVHQAGPALGEPEVRRLTEEVADVCAQAALVALGHQQVISASAAHGFADRPLGVQRIGGQQAAG